MSNMWLRVSKWVEVQFDELMIDSLFAHHAKLQTGKTREQIRRRTGSPPRQGGKHSVRL